MFLDQSEQFIVHRLRLEARACLTHSGIETVSLIVVGHFADPVDVQLRAEICLAISRTKLIKRARCPVLLAIDRQRRITPNWEADFTSTVAKSNPKVGFTFSSFQLFLRGKQCEKVPTLAIFACRRAELSPIISVIW